MEWMLFGLNFPWGVRALSRMIYLDVGTAAYWEKYNNKHNKPSDPNYAKDVYQKNELVTGMYEETNTSRWGERNLSELMQM